MKRWIHAATGSNRTSLQQVKDIISQSNLTRGREAALNAIQEWNVSPEDAQTLIADPNGGIKFNSKNQIKSISYGNSDKVDKAFVVEYYDGHKVLYGWKDWKSSYDGNIEHEWTYLGKVSTKAYSFEDILNNPRGRELVESIENDEDEIRGRGIDPNDTSEYYVYHRQDMIDALRQEFGVEWK